MCRLEMRIYWFELDGQPETGRWRMEKLQGGWWNAVRPRHQLTNTEPIANGSGLCAGLQ